MSLVSTELKKTAPRDQHRNLSAIVVVGGTEFASEGCFFEPRTQADPTCPQHIEQETVGCHIRARPDQQNDAEVLKQMGLAEQVGAREWMLRRDFETVLKAMQRTTDRQKMLASHGALLSDERLPLVVMDMRQLKTLEERVLAHGEEDVGKTAGRHYLLLEATDAKVHLIYYTPEMEEARSRGKLRPNASIRLQKQFENGRRVLEI